MAKTWLTLNVVFASLKFTFNSFFIFAVKGLKSLLEAFIAVAEARLDLPGVTFSLGISPDTIEKARGALFGLNLGIGDLVHSVENMKNKNALAVAGFVAQWGQAPEMLRADVVEFRAVFDDIMLQAVDAIAAHKPEFITRFQEMWAEARAALGGGLGGAGGFIAPDRSGISMTDADVNAFFPSPEDTKKQAFDWVEINLNALETVRAAFSDSFKAIIQGQKGFGRLLVRGMDQVSTQLLDVAFKAAFERIGINKALGLSNAAATAPTPFAIPLFVGVFLAAWSSLLGGSKFSGADGGTGTLGGAEAPPPPSAIPSVIEDVDVPDTSGGTEITIEFPDLEGAVAKAVVRGTRNGFGDGVSRLVLVGS